MIPKKFLLLIFCVSNFIFSQYQDSNLNNEYIRITGDTIVKGSIDLGEVLLLPKRPYKNSNEIKKYIILRRKIFKVYSYSVLASNRLNALNDRLNSLKSKRQKKKYIKIIQKYLENELTPELKKLTKTEGQILIKLIYRNTGITTFDIVKQLRVGVRAFFYNTTAKFFSMNLKTGFNPKINIEDYFIEDIIQRGIRDNFLDYKKPHKSYDLFELRKIWKKKR